jgi:hypothetical protein
VLTETAVIGNLPGLVGGRRGVEHGLELIQHPVGSSSVMIRPADNPPAVLITWPAASGVTNAD